MSLVNLGNVTLLLFILSTKVWFYFCWLSHLPSRQTNLCIYNIIIYHLYIHIYIYIGLWGSILCADRSFSCRLGPILFVYYGEWCVIECLAG